MLESNGHGRASVYHLPGAGIPTPEQVFGVPNSTVEHKAISAKFYSEGKDVYSEGSVENKVLYDRYGRVLSPMLNAPAIDDLKTLSPDFYKGLQIIA